jgi:2-keto-4-pentenoate hydratase/2-oxohepta-3-ene-1,7-dioic acid hydratase in catechol pathway
LKLVRYAADGVAQYGILENGFIYAVEGDVYSGSFAKGQAIGGIEVVRLLPPCNPKTITSIGANYASRCQENNLPIPTEPGKGDRFFIPVEALTGSGNLICLPTHEVRIEYSGELGIVIRRTCRNVTVDEADDYILGYTIVHNTWAKDPKGSTQNPRRQRIRAYESFCATGPCLVTDLDPRNVAWETRVNGEVRQRANTSDMLFSPAEMVASISTWHTLEPGDLIQCGTAAGVGLLKPGDTVDIEFAGIGVLRNLAVARENMTPANLIWIDYAGQ